VKKPETYIKMGIEGRKMAEERFDENKVIDQHLSLYNELLASGQ
jgi:glycosyltransferase involved in cell wall biosynthesis